MLNFFVTRGKHVTKAGPGNPYVEIYKSNKIILSLKNKLRK